MILRQVTRPAVRPVIRSVIDGGSGSTLDQQLAALHARSTQSLWLDPSDTSTLFQDSAGTVAGALNRPVGLVLDKSKKLELGPELAPELEAANWTVTNADATHIVTFSGGAMRYQSDTITPPLSVTRSGMLTVGKVYEITGNVSSYVSGALKSDSFNGIEITSAAGPFRKVGVATSTTMQISRNIANTDVAISLLSVRELKGNHASQSSTLSRPTSRAGYLEFDRADDSLAGATGGGGTAGVLIAAGIRANGAGTARTIWTDRGTNAGYRLSINASNQIVLSSGNGSAHVECVGDTVTAGTDYVVMGWHDGVNLRVQVNAETAAQQAFAAATAGTTGYTVAKDGGAASGFFGDRLYGLQYFRGTPLTDSERAIVRRYLAKQAGVAL